MQWHPFALKFPLLEGEEREALKESIRKTKGIDEQPILYRVVYGTRQGLDGRNRYLLCRELKIRPKMKKVVVPDAEVKDFILRRNVHRRHMTRELRQQIVAELRADGESIRQIAETIGVSKSTVASDVTAAAEKSGPGVQNRTPAAITGQDGKTYPATKPQTGHGDAYEGPVLCERCTRMGQAVKDCKSCEAARRQPSVQGKRPEGPKPGQVLFDWKAFRSDCDRVLRQIDTFGRPYLANNTPQAYGLRRLWSEFKKAFKTWAKEVSKITPPQD